MPKEKGGRLFYRQASNHESLPPIKTVKIILEDLVTPGAFHNINDAVPVWKAKCLTADRDKLIYSISKKASRYDLQCT